MVRTQATFAKLPTGELTVVLSLDYKRRSVSVGTRRHSTSTDTYKIIRMFVDSLVFQHGEIEKDRSGVCTVQKKRPYWYGSWRCKWGNWESFDKYYVTGAEAAV